jgi:glycosyltransferase involved in cell wall biosynthesis
MSATQHRFTLSVNAILAKIFGINVSRNDMASSASSNSVGAGREQRRLKILFLTVDSIDKGYFDECKRGLHPKHTLFGALELERDYNLEVIVPKTVKYPIINRIGNLFRIALLDQQFRALFSLSRCDVLYAPYGPANTKLIIVAKWLKLVRVPIVILVHDRVLGKPSKNRWKRHFIRKLICQFNTIIFTSQKMKHELAESYAFSQSYAAKHFRCFKPGIDMEYFRQFSANLALSERTIFSSGKTERDFNLVVRAAHRTNYPYKIYCRDNCYPTDPIPANVIIHSGFFPYKSICQEGANAGIILIPLQSNLNGTYGLTSLLEALAMGKRVIMTRNEKIEIDLVAANVGVVVEPGDVDALINAIEHLMRDPAELEKSSECCRQFVAEKFQMEAFTNNLLSALKETYALR